jgi:hypothetical protein
MAMASVVRNAGVLALFDVNGTLTAPRKVPPSQFSSFPDLFSLFLPPLLLLPVVPSFFPFCRIIVCFSETGCDV